MREALRAACAAALALALAPGRDGLAGEAAAGRPAAEGRTLAALLVREGAPVEGATVMARRLHREAAGAREACEAGGLSQERDPETGIDPSRLGEECGLGPGFSWAAGEPWARAETGADGRAAFEAEAGAWCVASRGWEPLAVEVPPASPAGRAAGLEVALKPQTLRVEKAVVTPDGDAAEASCEAGGAAVFALSAELPAWPQEFQFKDLLDPLLAPEGLVGCAVDGRPLACAWEARRAGGAWEVVMAPDLSGVAWGRDRTLRAEFAARLLEGAAEGSLDNDAELTSEGERVARSNTVRLRWGRPLPRTGDACGAGAGRMAAAAGASLLASAALAGRRARSGGP